MSGSINKVFLIGRVGKDPTSNTFANGGKVANFSLATSESWKDQGGERQTRTQWHNISVFNDALAEVTEKFVRKGSYLCVEGQLEHRQYEKDGDTKYVSEIVLRPFNGSITMLDRAPERPTEAPAQTRKRGTGPSGRR
jgi:single-strand DNA-binding protein